MFKETLRYVLLRAFFVWVLIILIETVHGIARTFLLEPFVGDLRARQISMFIGSAIIAVITLIFIRWIKGSGYRDFLFVGAMWVVLTVSFEFLLGRYVMGVSWDRIASDYNPFQGGLMVAGLIFMLFAPTVMAKLLGEI